MAIPNTDWDQLFAETHRNGSIGPRSAQPVFKADGPAKDSTEGDVPQGALTKDNTHHMLKGLK